jgi:peptidoglycan hydrolase-like protein with peptidoglycan-binding domain
LSSRTLSKILAILCALLLTAGMAAAKTSSKHTRRSSTSVKSSTHTSTSARSRRGLKRTKVSRRRGQQVIQQDRAREIQAALIREKYLDGEPTGVWDQRTKDAMARFQGDNGWQTKTLPDARALIKLGLGPDHDNVLNPETAATNPPQAIDPVRAEGPVNRQ